MNIKNDNKLTTINNWIWKKQEQKQNKQPEQEKNHRYGEHLEGYQLGGGRGRMGEKVQDQA